jgi:hypothetical protein
VPGSASNSYEQIQQNGVLGTTSQLGDNIVLPIGDTAPTDASTGGSDTQQAEQDRLIAENQGNTISEDDPLTSGSQEVAARYNQLAASYGDSVSLTSASVALSHDDQTGTIIYSNNASGPGEIQDDGEATSDVQGNSAQADAQASSIAGASGSTADNAANAVQSAAAINGLNAGSASATLNSNTPLYIDNSSGPSFVQGPSDPAGYLVDQVNDGSLLRDVVPAPASDQVITASMQAAPEPGESGNEFPGKLLEETNEVVEKVLEATSTVAGKELAEGLKGASKVFGGVAKILDFSERVSRVEALPTIVQKIEGTIGEGVDLAASTEYGEVVGTAVGLGALAVAEASGAAIFASVALPAAIIFGGAAAYEFGEEFGPNIRSLLLPPRPEGDNK